MDFQTALTVGIVVLVGGALLVTVRLGAVAAGLLPSGTGRNRSETPPGDAGEPEEGSKAGDGGRAHVTDDDCERMRRHLNKSRSRRSPDDLLPSNADETDPEDR